MKRKAKIFCFLCVLFPLFLLPAASESFRVRGIIIIALNDENAVTLALNDALVVTLPQDRMFLKGITFDIEIPPELASFPGTAAYSFYTNIKPEPRKERIDYSGDRAVIEVLPARIGLSIGVPYGTSDALKVSPYMRIVPFIATDSDALIFFRMQLVMKGIPNEVMAARVKVTVKPVYEDKGRLTLKIIYPRGVQERPYTVFIDEHAIELVNGGIILDAGLHHVSIVSDYYRNETRVITVNKAQTIPIEITLTDIAPHVTITAPNGTEVLFDGEKIDPSPKAFTITPGDHTVRFLLGGYEIIKTIHAVNGKNYSISLDLDVLIEENP